LEDDGSELEGRRSDRSLDLVTFEMIDGERRGHAVLLGRHAQAFRADERQLLLAELVAHRHLAVAEGRSPLIEDGVAIQMRGGIEDAAAVLVDRVAEAERGLHRWMLRVELVDERHLLGRESDRVLLELVALEMVERVSRRRADQRRDEEEAWPEAVRAGELRRALPHADHFICPLRTGQSAGRRGSPFAHEVACSEQARREVAGRKEA